MPPAPLFFLLFLVVKWVSCCPKDNNNSLSLPPYLSYSCSTTRKITPDSYHYCTFPSSPPPPPLSSSPAGHWLLSRDQVSFLDWVLTLSPGHAFTHWVLTTTLHGSITVAPVLWMRKLRLEEVQSPAPSHINGQIGVQTASFLLPRHLFHALPNWPNSTRAALQSS